MDANNHIHQALSALFIGPHGENMNIFQERIAIILMELKSARKSYAPNDQKAITSFMQDTHGFQSVSRRISEAIFSANRLLAKHSVPCWSPRYGAHMYSDPSMPALLGYFMGMLYNSNNISPDVSPFTTAVEEEVGNQFCRMFGYPVGGKDGKASSWGHITCDGRWLILSRCVARNLKYYPLSLWLAITEGELVFIADSFQVQTCVGSKKLFKDLDTWQLLNLRPETVLDLPGALYRTFVISERFLDTVLAKHSVEELGMEDLNRRFGIDRPMQFLLRKTNHYSWKKGGGVLGIGANSVVGVDITDQARISLETLKAHLQDRLEKKQAVFAVVALIGSTEVGAVDPLRQILALRIRYQDQGLSFLVHADAAWGGYFTTMLPRDGNDFPITSSQAARFKGTIPVPPHAMRLSEKTEDAFAALRDTDSITIDPHKAGYVPYPAGGVVYRDKRMGDLVSCTGPYLAEGSSGIIGL